jgi:hypothetical protein
MTSSQDTLGTLDVASQGIHSALDALDQIRDREAPRVTIDGIQHELSEVEQRLQALCEGLPPAGKPSSQDRREGSAR